MSVKVAEYLGQRTDVNNPTIAPASRGDMCPFMDAPCKKLVPQQLQKPICSVRKGDGQLWIVCEHRLCATKKTARRAGVRTPRPIRLNEYQKNRIMEIARLIYGGAIGENDILLKREAPVPVGGDNSNYKADFVIKRRNVVGGEVLEMQGGGETSNTGHITRHVTDWENMPNRTNEFLRETIAQAGTIETNAWRRQQEQFLIKGNVAEKTGHGRIVFCVGSLLYDYLVSRILGAGLRDIRDHGWTLALIAFKEDTSRPPQAGAIPLVIDHEKTLFTTYSSFVRALTDQGEPYPPLFTEGFEDL